VSSPRGGRKGDRAGLSSARPGNAPTAREFAALLAQLDVQGEALRRGNERLEELQDDLERATFRYRDLLENLPLAYCTLDRFGVVVEANPALAKFVRRERVHLLGRPFVRMVVDPDRGKFFTHIRRCRAGESTRTELRVHVEAEVIPVALVTQAAAGAVDELERFRTAIFDLAEQRRAEEAGARVERERRRDEQEATAARAADDARDRFLAELSHELRTPLTPILATVSSLRMRAGIPESLRGPLEVVQRNVEVEARLIDDLLDVSRIATGRVHLEIAPVDVHRTLRDVVANLESEIEKSGVVFGVELGARRNWVRGDELRLNQIFWNLLRNALRNTPAGGHVVVSTVNIGDDLRILVRDTGVGIEPERLEEIFSPFSKEQPAQRSQHGLGLGLAIVKGLVEAHRGRILAFSAGKGEGSTFVVELRSSEAAAKAVAESEETPAVQVRSRGNGIRVLVVEDHQDTRAAIETLLRLNGYDVRVAGDIPAALVEARKEVDLVICDIGLPNGSGLDLLREIHEERPLKAIALSGYGSPRDVERAVQAGFSQHLTKPVDAERLLATIERLVVRGDARQSGKPDGAVR